MAGVYFYGNRSVLGPTLAIASQAPWWLIMVDGSLWGLLPINIMSLVIHTRNFIKWRREHH